MSLWLVRAGRNGEQEEGALRHSVATIGWEEMPDLSPIKSKEELKDLYEKVYPGAKKKTVANEVAQVWTFGDLIEAVLKNYDNFPETLQAELPLKKIYRLVLEEE
jgi:restriction system protein